MIVCVIDTVNKQVVASCNAADFAAVAAQYGRPVLYKSAGKPFFISDGYLFTCEPPQ